MSLNKEQTIADLSIEAQILRTIGGTPLGKKDFRGSRTKMT